MVESVRCFDQLWFGRAPVSSAYRKWLELLKPLPNKTSHLSGLLCGSQSSAVIFTRRAGVKQSDVLFIYFCCSCYHVCSSDTPLIVLTLMLLELWCGKMQRSSCFRVSHMKSSPMLHQRACVKWPEWKWGQSCHSAHSPWETGIQQWAENRKPVGKFVNKARKWPLRFCRGHSCSSRSQNILRKFLLFHL